MLRQRFNHSNSRSHNKISPSPKPFNLKMGPQHPPQRSIAKQGLHQHRRIKTLSGFDEISDQPRIFAMKKCKDHQRSQSSVPEETRTCIKNNFNDITNKIKNILQNYKQYDNLPDPSHHHKQKYNHQCQNESHQFEKRTKNIKGINKQNEMCNAKESNQAEMYTFKNKIVPNVLQEMKNDEFSENTFLSQFNSTFSTKNISSIGNLSQIHEDNSLQSSYSPQTNLSYSATTQNSSEQMVKRPKIFQKLKKSSQKLMAASNVDDEQQFKGIHVYQKDKLVNLLYNQILLDERFIKAKQWFKMYKKEHKWWLLERQLKKNRLWINQLTMKATFITKLQEQSPEQAIKFDQYSIKTLVLAFRQAEEHWLSKIRNNFEYDSLKEQGFMEQRLDMNKKGHISIEDIIRFMNYELKTFYSNRQLQLIYLRLKQSQNLQFYDIIENITKSMV